MQEFEAFIILNNIPNLGPVRVHHLLRHFSSASGILKATKEELSPLAGMGEKTIEGLLNWQKQPAWRQDLELVKRCRAVVLPCTDLRYPQRLLSIDDAPILLYAFGNIAALKVPSIAVIGTRACSPYGKEMASRFSRDIAHAGIPVVSGLARGIDTAAHRAALETGTTIAVIGSGLTRIYPAENLSLAREICKKGVVLSELPMATPPSRQTFPRRNRIVSGLSEAVLLIEADVRSGAMITMRTALRQKRQLYQQFPQ